MATMIAEGRVLWPAKPDGRPRHKKFLNEVTRHETGFSSWLDSVGQTSEGTQTIQDLFGEKVFPFAKPNSLMRTLIEQATPEGNGLIIDFFAGTGTTAHAVFEQNAADGGKRRVLLVQFPEPLDRRDYPTISKLTCQRLKLAAKRLRKENPLFKGDTGFRVFKLDASNMAEWLPQRDDLQGSLAARVTHLKPERTEDDILYELLLKLGLDLAVPTDTKTIAGKKVHSVGAGSLIACLDTKITGADSEALALGIAKWHKELNPAGETAVVFRDDAFADDVVKTNVAAILEQHGLKNVRSL